jgi:hypothetical protein
MTRIGPDCVAKSGLIFPLQIGSCLEHACLTAFDIKDAVGLEVEVSGAVSCVGRLQLLSVLNVKSHGRAILMVHARIHRDRKA